MKLESASESMQLIRKRLAFVSLMGSIILIGFWSQVWASTKATTTHSVSLEFAQWGTWVGVTLLGLWFMDRHRSKPSLLRRLSILLAVWVTVCFASVLVHRSAETTIVDVLSSAATFGLIPSKPEVPGLQTCWTLLVCAAWIAGKSLVVARSSSRHVDGPGEITHSETGTDDARRGSWLASLDRFQIAICLFFFGVFSFGVSVFDLFARQHVERAVVSPSSGEITSFMGPLLPTFIWSTIASGALGLLVFLPLWVSFSLRSADPNRNFGSRGSAAGGPSQLFASSVWIIALAFWIRIATLLTIAPTRTDGGDPLFYHVTANLLARGRGFPEPLNFIAFERWIPSALHGPAYPVVLSISSRLGGSTYFDHKVLSILIGTAVVALSMLLAYRVAPAHLRTAAVLISGILAAAYPNLWLVDSVLFPEGLMALFTLGIVVACYKWWTTPCLRTAVLIGCLLAASALTRGEGLLLAVLLVAPLFLSARKISLKRRVLQLMAAGMATVILLAPWTIRNARSFETFVPLSTNGNELFVYANCPPVYEGKFLGFWLFQCQEDLRAETGEPSGDEAEKALYWRARGLEFARDHAADLPRVIAARVGRQWDVFRPWQNTEFAPIEGRNKEAARLGLFMYYAMFPVSVLGLHLLRRNKVRILPFVAVFASVTLTAAYAYGTTRFRVPFEPLLCVLAGIGGAHAVGRIRSRWRPSPRFALINTPDFGRRRETFVEGGRIIWRSAVTRASARSWLSFALVSTGVLLTLPALYHAVGSSMEEGFMLVFPELVMRGRVPNVDFLHLYGPTSLHFLSTWFQIFDASIWSERTFGLLQHVAFVAGLVVLTRPWGRATSTLVGAVSLVFTLTPVGLQALAWNGALALGIWSLIFALRALHSDARSSWIVCGALAGLALGFRPDVVLALSLSIGLLLWSQKCRSLMDFTIGLVIGLLPVIVHVWKAGIEDSFRGMILDPVFNLRPGRALPRPPSLDRLDGALQVIAEKFAPWWGFPHLSAPQQLFMWFFLLPVIAVANFLIARRVSSHRRERVVLTASALFGIGLLPQALQRPDSAHLLWVSAFVLPISVVAMFEWMRRRYSNSHPELALFTGVTVLCAIVVLLIPFYTIRTYADLVVRSVSGRTDVREVERGDRTFFLGDERPWRATLEVVDDLDALAEPGQRLFVGPVDLRQTAYSDVFFYHLFPELEPATYYIEMDPGLANRDPRLASDVASADWLILTRFWSGWIEPNTSIEFGSDEPNQIVEQSFCLARSYQNDLVRLYRKCANGDGIGPYEGPYAPEHDYAVEVLVPVPPRPDGTCTPTCRGRPSSTGVEIGIDTSVIE